MVLLSRYWEILKLDPAEEGLGYKNRLLPLALEFFQQQFPQFNAIPEQVDASPSQHQMIQALLYTCFRIAPSQKVFQAAKAGICLRCYISYPILNACKKLVRQFPMSGFTYRDLLPFVLDDDGKTPIILDDDGKTQRVVDDQGNSQESRFPLFTVEILRKFAPQGQFNATLETWVYVQTKQNSKLKVFLAEQGFCFLSDWALLNKVGASQLDGLSHRDRALIAAFHAIYRRDRRQQLQHRLGTCPDPTEAQLHDMVTVLKHAGVVVRAADLLHELKHMAKALRQLDIWSRRGSPVAETLEMADPETGLERDFPDPGSTNDLSAIERQDVQEFCQHQLLLCLDQGIQQGLHEHIANLQQRPRYASFATKVIPGLWLIYSQGKSQGESAPLLGMTNQVQVSRVLNLKDLLSRIRLRTVEKLFQVVLDKATGLEPTQMTIAPDYVNHLCQMVEEFVDAEIFQAAEAEIMTTKHRSFNSIYAQHLRQAIEKHQEDGRS